MTAAQNQLRSALADRYRIERELGRGGMATVWLARDLKHDRPVALKVLHPELAATLGPERFLREIRLAAGLQHPHILGVLDSGDAVGQLWYTMPYVAGESLRDRLRREIQLPVEDAVRITRDVALALDFAHRQGVVHRDIKPENILLSDNQALIADFGVAQGVEQGGASRLTETGLALGTPQYMSPEQAAGSRVDGRSDLYSLGCVLYELLAGEPPYTGPTPQSITTKRLTEPVPRVRRLRATVPEPLDAAIHRALALVPADRFATVAEFAQVLAERLLSQPNVVTPPPPPHARGASRQRIALVELLLGLVLVSGLLARARLGSRAAPASERKMLAVLPLKNLGASSDQYFADGLTDEITSRLASLSGMGVISRTSADRYRNTAKPLKEVGRELGATYLLEGSIRWDRGPSGRSRIRVTPQLIRVSDDSHVWADRFDADLADVFQVQGNIAERVASALDLALQEPERRSLNAQPTANLSAYDAYLRGNALYPTDFTGGLDQITSGLGRAAEQYREAIRLDSSFALAYAKLGTAMVFLYDKGPHEASTAAAAQQAIARALELAPTLSDAHLARGLYHFVVERDTVHALKELEATLTTRPNDAELLIHLAQVEWRVRGPKSRAIPHAERAVLLDPLSASKILGLADLYRQQQQFDQAERLYDRVIGLDFRNPGPYVRKAFVRLLRDGDTTGARGIVREAAQLVDSMALITAAVTNQATWHALGMLDEPYQRALLTLRPEAFGGDTAWFGLAVGYTYRARGDSVRFHAYYDTAYAAASARLREQPNDWWFRLITMWVLAGRGQRTAAYAVLPWVEASRVELGTLGRGEFEARVFVIAGDYDRALKRLQQGEWGPHLTIPWLCADHFWDPLRADPRFRRIVKGRCR